MSFMCFSARATFSHQDSVMEYTPIMKDKPTQTTPKGYEIPVPKKRDFDQMLERAAKPVKKSAPRRPKK